MKVMSEIPAEVAGEIVAIPAGDAELIYAGAPVVVVRPL
jgi:biotin carboxyl carrier protein